MGERPPSGPVLVTGASGFVGRRACEVFAERGCEVRRALRRGCGTGGIVVGEIGPDTDWTSALDGAATVVHLAARVHVMQDDAADPLAEYRRVNRDGTAALARQAAAAGVRRLVFVSTIKVNGEATDAQPFRAEDPPRPQDAYGRSKAEAEEVLWQIAAQTGLEVTVIRPPLVYGPGVGGNFRRLLGLVERGYPLPLAKVDNRRTLVGRDNLVDLIVRCLESPQAAGEVFLAGDGEDLSTAELIGRLALLMGRRPPLLPVPPSWLRTVARLVGCKAQAERLCGSLQVDIGKAETSLGWRPPVRMDDELGRTVVAYLGH